MSNTFKCTDCHMTFGTTGLLQKHKRKFCVGGSLGDPDNLLLRKGLYSADSPRQRPISPDDRDYPHYNPNQEAQLRQLAENHGRQMEYLQIKNRDLEKQREDIRRRLEQLGRKPPTTDNTADLLAELRAQEERNQRALNELRKQLYEMGHKRVNVIEVEKPTNYQPPTIIQQAPPPPPPQESGRKSYIYPVYYGNSLVAEITAMRQAYLQNGGNDPDVLSQLSQMQAEAQKIEDEMKNANYDNRHREKKPDISGKMAMIELENERLHKELMLIQEQNFLNQNRRKTDREDELERELQRLREDQLRKMMELQNEIALLKQRAMLERRPDPPQAPPQPKNAEMPWLLQRPYVDVEPMQPYDQYPNRYVPTGHHTWVSTQYDKMSRQVPPTARPERENENNDIDDVD